jgi:hypothetical protein
MSLYYDLFWPSNGKRAETSGKCKLSQPLFEPNRRSAIDPRDKEKCNIGIVWYDSSEPLPYPVDYSLLPETGPSTSESRHEHFHLRLWT